MTLRRRENPVAERRDPYETLYPPCLPGPVRRLLLAASACSQQDSSQASTVSESSVESEATPTPEPTEAPTPEPSTPTPAPTPSPEPESSPAAGDFEAAFADNPIDAQLEEDLSFASSNVLIQQAYSSAVARWETLIQTAYAQAEEDLSPEAFSTLQAEQEAWEQGREASVQSLRTQNSDDPLAAAGPSPSFTAPGARSCARPSTMPPASCPLSRRQTAAPRAKSLYFPPREKRGPLVRRLPQTPPP